MSVVDRQSRDTQIRALAKLGWGSDAIAGEVGVSSARVRQILSDPDPDALLAERVVALEAELAELHRSRETNMRRIRVIRRTLDRIAEEREARSIDRLLGLA